MKRDDAFLLDILRFSERAIRAANARHLEELQRDETLQSALVHPLIVIGEAVKGLSREFREENSQIPWTQMLACVTGSFTPTIAPIGNWFGKR